MMSFGNNASCECMVRSQANKKFDFIMHKRLNQVQERVVQTTQIRRSDRVACGRQQLMLVCRQWQATSPGGACDYGTN
jgi:hypothetical protein